MKNRYLSFFIVLIGMVFLMPWQQVKAQDEMIVEWEDPVTHEVIKDALRTAIENDTNRPEGRVYKLRKGGFYWITETIVNDGWHLRIEGEEPGATELENPAVFQMVARENGTVNGRMLTGGGDITLKNLYIIGADDAGVQTYYQPIQIDASDSRFVIDNCIFEKTNFALMAFTAGNNDIFFRNCKFRNLIGQPSTQQWEGRGISVWADQDSVVVENCTFFNLGFTAFQLENGAANYLLMNHNTFVNIGRGFNTVPWYREAYIANSLIINGFWHGEGYGDVSAAGRDPRQWFSGMWGIGALPSKYGPDEGRRILLANVAAWRDPAFAAFYADTIRPQWFVGPVAKEDYLDIYTNNMVVRDTMWLANNPGLTTYPSDIIDDMIQNITDLRAGTTPAHPYFWMNPEDPLTPSWPLPENFTYTDASLMTAGTDGLPLGDLNWFPTQKAQYEANKAEYVQGVQDLVSGIDIQVIGTVEAENSTLGGTAVVEDYAGDLPYFDMDGGGFIEWKFNMPQAATVELVVTTRSQDAVRGQHIRVNKTEGTGLRNDAGYGEYYWNDLTNEWKAYTITAAGLIENAADLDLQAGENFIRLAPSWGYQEFLSVEVKSGGSTIVNLNAGNVTTVDIVNVVSPDPSIYVPSGFKSVNMGASGTVSFPINAAAAGIYAVTIFYQAPNGTQTGQLQTGSATKDITFEGEAGNNDGHQIFSGQFSLAQGSNTITLSAGNILVDWIQISQITTSVSTRPEIPETFALKQNYPNPFNPMTNIDFDLIQPSNVKLTIYNSLGEKVATLIDNVYMNTGAFTYQFDARNLASGVYFYSLEAGEFRVQRKMMLLK